MSFYNNRYARTGGYSNAARRNLSAPMPSNRPAATCDFADPKWVAFKEVQPVRAAWVEAKAASFDFAAAMFAAVVRFGDLTQGQTDAVDRCVARDAQRASQRATVAPQTAANRLDMVAVRAALDARVAARKAPKFVIEGFAISLAPATGRNPGAIYVKDNGTYVGKIAAGSDVFQSGRDFDPARMVTLQAVFADPRGAVQAQAARIAAELAAAEAAGRPITLPCGCCGIILTDPVSVARGIGPICAGKWGF